MSSIRANAQTALQNFHARILSEAVVYIDPAWTVDLNTSSLLVINANEPSLVQATKTLLNVIKSLQDILKNPVNIFAWRALRAEYSKLSAFEIPEEIKNAIANLSDPSLPKKIPTRETPAPQAKKTDVNAELASLYRTITAIADPQNPAHKKSFHNNEGVASKAVRLMSTAIQKATKKESPVLNQLKQVAKELDALERLNAQRKEQFETLAGSIDWISEASGRINHLVAEFKKLDKAITATAKELLPEINRFITNISKFIRNTLLAIDKFEIEMGLKAGSISSKFTPLVDNFRQFIQRINLPLPADLQPPYWNERLQQLEEMEKRNASKITHLTDIQQALKEDNVSQALSHNTSASNISTRTQEAVTRYIDVQAPATYLPGGIMLPPSLQNMTHRAVAAVKNEKQAVIKIVTSEKEVAVHNKSRIQNKMAELKQNATLDKEKQTSQAQQMLAFIIKALENLTAQLNQEKLTYFASLFQPTKVYKIETLEKNIAHLKTFKKLNPTEIRYDLGQFFSKTLQDKNLNDGIKVKTELKRLHATYNHFLRQSEVPTLNSPANVQSKLGK